MFDSRVSLLRIAKLLGAWLASNAIWTLTSGAIGFAVSAAIAGLVGVANAYLLVAVALGFAAGVLVFIRPRVRRWWAVRNRDIAVEIEREDWHNFNYRARIVEVRVRVKNRTNREKKIIATRVQTPGGHGVGSVAVHEEMGNIEVLREVHRRRGQLRLLRSPLEPRETQHGSMVFAFPWTTEPGPTPYDLVLIDELNVEYEAKRR